MSEASDSRRDPICLISRTPEPALKGRSFGHRNIHEERIFRHGADRHVPIVTVRFGENPEILGAGRYGVLPGCFTGESSTHRICRVGMSEQNGAVLPDQVEYEAVYRVRRFVDGREGFRVHAGENDAGELAGRILQSSGEDDGLGSINPVGDWNRRAQLIPGAGTRALKIVAIGDIDCGRRPSRCRNHDLTICIGNGHVEYLRQLGDELIERVVDIPAIECSVKFGASFDVPAAALSLDLQ